MSRGLALFLAVIVAIGILVGIGPPAAARDSARQTKIEVVTPVAHAGLAHQYSVTKTVAGSCGSGIAGSEVVWFGAVYRCTYGHFVVDPCWADPRSAERLAVVCVTSPWKHQATVITLDRPLRRHTPQPRVNWGLPWGLTLADGTRCEALQGAHSSVDGRVLDYGCYDDKTLVLRGIDRTTQPWTVDLVVKGEVGPTRVPVESAWYGFGGPAEEAPSRLPFSGFPTIAALLLAAALIASGGALVRVARTTE
jgi:hypothetical protein